MILCRGCKKPIFGDYTKALGFDWHKPCFVCTICHRPFPDHQFVAHEGKPYCQRDYHEKFGELCPGCGQLITNQYIEALGQKWHKDHFVCTTCGKPFPDGAFLQHEGKAYCERDFYENFGTRCSVCHEPVRGQYFTDSWENSFCGRHTQELRQCFTCRRLICEGITGGGVDYEDGRRMCNLCRKSAIDDLEDALPLFSKVQKVLEKQGLGLDKNVRMPLRLASESDIDLLAGGTPQIEAGISVLEVLSINGLETARNVTEIVILYGLPITHASAIMAHELGHVWCLLNHMPDLSSPVQEGICEMFSYGYLSQLDTPESRFHMKGIEDNHDPVYGGGFRLVRDALRGRTLAALLKDVKTHGDLC